MGRHAEDAAAFPVGRIALSGDFDAALAERSAAEAEVWYRRLLTESRPADRAAGRALSGPHRSDLEVVLAEKNMPAAKSSTGEQKALLIGLVLAHAELVAEVSGMTPVLTALGSQAFMTGTDPILFEALRGSAEMFRVADNNVVRMEGENPS
jgi:DNA replication and repair protein RecF